MNVNALAGLAAIVVAFVVGYLAWRYEHKRVLDAQRCGFRYLTEHGEPRMCTLAREHHLDGMDDPHQYGGRRAGVGVTVALLLFTLAVLVCAHRASAQDCRDHPARFQQECVDLDLTPLIEALRQRPAYGATACGISTVGYRFVGEAGQRFRYAGDTYEIERDGATELIAARHRKTYAVEGRILPLEVWPRDQFGFREARLPKRTAAP